MGLLPPPGADVRQRRARDPGGALRGRDRAGQAGARRDARHRARRRRAARADRELQVVLRLPDRPTAAADRGDPGRVRLVDGRAGRSVPADQPASGRLGDGRQRAADGVRQQGRDIVLRGGLQPRRGHRRADAVGGLPAARPGGGRRLRGPHAARPLRAARLDAGGRRSADRDPAQARGPLQGHAGHRVHGRGGAPVHAPDAGAPSGPRRPRCASRSTRSRSGC